MRSFAKRASVPSRSPAATRPGGLVQGRAATPLLRWGSGAEQGAAGHGWEARAGGAGPAAGNRPSVAPGRDLARIGVHADARAARPPELTAERGGEAAERAADRVAERVMRLSDVPRAPGFPAPGHAAPGATRPDFVPASPMPRLPHGNGTPLDSRTRAFFEPRLGAPLEHVRVHTDARAGEMACALNARAFTHGRDIYFAPDQFDPGSGAGRRLIAHELAHTIQQQAHPGARIQRFSFGDDGVLSDAHRRAVSVAAGIAEQRVLREDFAARWSAFWSGPGRRISPRPTLAAYRAAVRNRRFHDMDSSRRADVRDLVTDERPLPTERQTAAVTVLGSQDTYLRRFLIEQGTDALVSTILHESLHGAGAEMGPFLVFEPAFHQFEASIGFPMMMGGADVLSITQRGLGEGLVEVRVSYRLRLVGDEPELPQELEIQLVSPATGERVAGPATHGRVPSAPGEHAWTGRVGERQGAGISVRIASRAQPILLGARQFVLGSPLRELGREDPCAQLCETRFEQCLSGAGGGRALSPLRPMRCISQRQSCLLGCAGMSASSAARFARRERGR